MVDPIRDHSPVAMAAPGYGRPEPISLSISHFYTFFMVLISRPTNFGLGFKAYSLVLVRDLALTHCGWYWQILF